MCNRRGRRVVAVVGMLLSAAAQSLPAHAGTEPAAAWAQPVRWFFSTTGSPYTADQMVPVIGQAMSHWSSATGGRLAFQYQGTTTATTRCGVGGVPGTDDQYIVWLELQPRRLGRIRLLGLGRDGHRPGRHQPQPEPRHVGAQQLVLSRPA